MKNPPRGHFRVQTLIAILSDLIWGKRVTDMKIKQLKVAFFIRLLKIRTYIQKLWTLYTTVCAQQYHFRQPHTAKRNLEILKHELKK